MSSTKGVYFNGKLLTIPGAYSSVESSMTSTKAGNEAKMIAILGECAGGEPETVQFFTEPSVAKKVLKRGDLLKAMQKAWNPVSKTKEGVSLGGANTIAVIRTNKATKGKSTISQSEKTVFEIQSKDWGADASNIQHKISDGTSAGTKKLTICDTKNDTYEIYDNLGKIFSIKYTGEQKYATISITLDDDGNATKLQTRIGANAESAIVDLDLDLSDNTFNNVASLIRILSSYENYELTPYNSYNTELSVADLDSVVAGDLLVGTAVTAVLPDMKKRVALQSRLCEIGTITREALNLDNYEFTSLTGGSEGASPASWVDYFDMLARYNITYIVPLTDSPSIIAECHEHVKHMSENMGKERRMICGGGNKVTVDDAIATARKLSGDRCQYVYPGMYDLNDSLGLELYPAYILAAQHAGRAAFLPDGEAATHDHYKMSAIETELEPDEITKLLNAGVVTFELVTSGNAYDTSSVRLVQDLTTYTTDTDPLYCERAIGITADTLNKDLRRDLDDLLVGKRTTTATLTTARNRVISILQKRIKDEIIVAYKDVTVYKESGTVWVEYSVAPAEPTNFVLIKSHFYSEDLVASTESSN